MEHKSPVITDLQKNQDLLGMILTVILGIRVRSAHLLGPLRLVLQVARGVNTSSLPDELFLLWLARAIHVQIGHLRQLQMYPCRYQHRIEQLNDGDKVALPRVACRGRWLGYGFGCHCPPCPRMSAA